MSLLVSDSYLEMLSNHPNLQEVLWNFSCLKDEEKRLTLVEHPHFYAELPASPEAYVDNVKIDPTEDFGHTDKFYVLTDKPEPIHIMTDQVSRSFGNFWCPKTALIFKGLGVVFIPPSLVFEVFRYLWDAQGRKHHQGISQRIALLVL